LVLVLSGQVENLLILPLRHKDTKTELSLGAFVSSWLLFFNKKISLSFKTVSEFV
jgi:hypothetical protein